MSETPLQFVTMEQFEEMAHGVDSFFLLTMAMLIFLMQCGFAFLEAGSVRSKNTTNILIKNLLDSCITAICYWATGWSFAFGQNNLGFGSFCGFSDFFSIGMDPKNYAMWFFQFTFACTASTIVSGALAERCEFVTYFAYCASLTLYLYPIVTHWAWHPDGWLKAGPGGDITFVDYAGSGVVHLLGGTCAFVGAALLGPRIGRFPKSGEPEIDIKGHSVPFAALGGFILMFGFFAFNGGSQTHVTSPGDGEIIANSMINTMLSGGGAAITTLVINKFLLQHKKWSLLLTINAALTGMVSACAGCDQLYPWAALVIGIGAGLSYTTVSASVEKLKIDDPLDAVGVHFGGGLWGLLATPVFTKDKGIIYSLSSTAFGTLGWNFVGAISIISWGAVTMGVTFFIMKKLKILRVSEEVERKGLDIYKHGEPAYPLIAYGHGWADDFLNDPNLTPAQRRRSMSANMGLAERSLANLAFENSEVHARHVHQIRVNYHNEQSQSDAVRIKVVREEEQNNTKF